MDGRRKEKGRRTLVAIEHDAGAALERNRPA